MDVLVISQHYWPESFRINDVVDSLRRAGCSVTVLAGQPNYPEGRIYPGYSAAGVGSQTHPAGYTIHRVPVIPRGRGGALRLAANYLSFVLTSSTLGLWLLRRSRFDVVFVYGISPILQGIAGILLRRTKGAALVIWIQDLWPQSLEATGYLRNRLVLSAVGAITGWIYRSADLLLVQSPAFEDDVRQLAGDGVEILFHPTPGERDEPPSDVAQGLVLDPGFNVVFTGNLGSAQALATVLEAAELIANAADIRIVLVGSGSRSSWLAEEISRRLIRNVQLAGRFPSEAIPFILSQSSALLLSLGKSDALGKTIPAKLTSYLAAARPVIVSADGEAARIATEAGAGLTAPAEDANALAAAMLKMRGLADTERAKMGERGRAYFERFFAPARLAEELLVHFERAGDRRGRHSISRRDAVDD